MKKIIYLIAALFVVMVLSSIIGAVTLYGSNQDDQVSSKKINITKTLAGDYDNLMLDMGYDDVNILTCNGTKIKIHYHGQIKSTQDDFGASLDVHERHNSLEIDKRSYSRDNKPKLFNLEGYSRENLVLDVCVPPRMYDLEVSGSNVKAVGLNLSGLYLDSRTADLTDIFTRVSEISTSGTIHINRMKSHEFWYDTYSGDAYFSNVTSNSFSADLHSGNLQAHFKNYSESVIVEGSSSQVRLEGLLAGKLKVDLSSGQLDILDSVVNNMVTETYSADVKAQLQAENLTIDTNSGDVTLDLPENADFKLYFDTYAGNLKNDFAIVLDKAEEGEFSGLVGNKSQAGKITVETFSGNLHIN